MRLFRPTLEHSTEFNSMHDFINNSIGDLHTAFLFGIIAITLLALGKGADLLVEEAVALSTRLGISKVLIGATIVSLGTTLPEVTVSVMAAIGGNPDLALGNAVGSVICDTGLILGIATLIGKIPLNRTLLNRQGYIQLGVGFLLVVACLPFANLGSVFTEGGSLPQVVGFGFLVLLGGYLWISTRWAKSGEGASLEVESHEKAALPMILFKIFCGLALIILSSEVLIPTVEETALRFDVPQSIIAATLVAFGTSLPELVTAVTAVRKGHGELAIGNVIGADILNVLFVAGMAAAVTPSGLQASPNFFTTLFPAMIVLLLVLRASIVFSKDNLSKIGGAALLLGYIGYLVISL